MWADIQFSLLKSNSSGVFHRTHNRIHVHVVTHMNSNATKVNMKHLTFELCLTYILYQEISLMLFRNPTMLCCTLFSLTIIPSAFMACNPKVLYSMVVAVNINWWQSRS